MGRGLPGRLEGGKLRVRVRVRVQVQVREGEIRAAQIGGPVPQTSFSEETHEECFERAFERVFGMRSAWRLSLVWRHDELL